jgi:hypothetical protein
VNDERQATVIEATPEAIDFIRERGGTVYIWTDSAGMGYVRVRPPRHPVEFNHLYGDGFELLQDVRIPRPWKWKLVHHWYPVRHLEALYNGQPGSSEYPMAGP